MFQSSCFRTPFGSQSFHGRQTLLKSFFQDVYRNFPLILDKLSEKTSLFFWCESLGVFGKTLDADHMDSRHNWGKLPQYVKTPLSQTGKTFSAIFIGFLQSTQNFGDLKKNDQVYSLNSLEVIVSEKCGCLNAWKLLFQNTLRESKCWRVSSTAEIFLAAPVF